MEKARNQKEKIAIAPNHLNCHQIYILKNFLKKHPVTIQVTAYDEMQKTPGETPFWRLSFKVYFEWKKGFRGFEP